MIELGSECVLGEHYFATARDQAEKLRMGRVAGRVQEIAQS
jgi:hypothetical protein